MRDGQNLLCDRIRRALIVAACLLAPVAPAHADIDADLFLFTTSVAPNVAIVLDNSGSMNNIVWHPAYDPTVLPSCANFVDGGGYGVSANVTITVCGNTRTVYHDSASLGFTRIDGRYLNWYFSDEADPYFVDIDSGTNGSRACGGGSPPSTFGKYQRNRLSAAKQVVLDTICLVVATKEARFGLGVFREPNDGAGVDPNGGYMEVGVDDYTPAQAIALDNAIALELADTWTPLAETLFQVYTYFMGRGTGEQPPGAVANTFPVYEYSRSTASRGGVFSTSGPPTVPQCPVQFSCQKNFVIIITDGEPTMDDFDSDPNSTAAGFDDFNDLIGDFNPDGEFETPGGGWEQALYLDDVAKFMHETDFRPDLPGDQVLDVYTIGFTTTGPANALLEKTADQGNGIFFSSNNAEELTAAIVSAITDIIEKSQSFTAATVPSTRTAAGGDFYTSFFLPTGKSSFWQGHLRAFGIDAAGNIFDSTGTCPLVDPTPGECNSGPFLPGVSPFWDAGEQVPTPGLRKLYTTTLTGTVPTRVVFDTTLTATDLAIAPFAAPPAAAPNPIYPGSGALNAEGLADEVISYGRGCRWKTGVSGPDVSADLPCVARTWRLGDIFHSAPVVVGKPRSAFRDASYTAFASIHQNRRRIIYAGANDGFLHALDAGTWNTAATPPGYTRGTGTELFGVMPWEARQNIKSLRIDDPSARHYYVDGSPQASDIWLYPTPTTATKAAGGSEWRSYLFSGMRQGGRSYFALDITDPSNIGYPRYAWDFPGEADPDDTSNATSILPYMGQGWSQPVITRVRVAVDGNTNSGKGFERWVMIIGGGYASNGDPNDLSNYDPNAIEGRSILIVDIKTGKLLAMQKFEPLAMPGDPRRDMRYAIPSTPAVLDLNFDGFADEILIGDLGGQLWKWVIKPIGEDRVNDSSPAGDYSQPNWPFKKFFSAPVESVLGIDYFKSIYHPIAAAYQQKNLWYTFGTGERNNVKFEGFPAPADENNRIYVIKDLDPMELSMPARATFVEADLTDLSTTQTCTSVSTPGYYFKLADGEKIVTNVEIFAGLVLTGSFTPANTGDPCTSKGNGNLYVFDIACGEGYFQDAGGNPQRGFDIGEGMPTDPQVSVGVDGKDNMVFIEKSGADLESIKAPNIPAGAKTLLYWRELY